MSKSEDYLDGLLHAATSEGDAGENSTTQEAESIMDSEKKFLDDFEKQLLEDDNDDSFLLDFEKELNDVESTSSEDETVGIANDNQSFLDDLNGIVNGAKQVMEEKQENAGEFSDFQVDTLSDTLSDSFGDESLGMPDEPMQSVNEEEEAQMENPKAQDDGMDLMSLFDGDEDFSEIGEMLHGGKSGLDELNQVEEPEEDGKKKKKKAKKEKTDGEPKKEGFLQKMGRILFGEDEEEEVKEISKKGEKVPITSDSMEIEELSDENMEILAALSGGGAEQAPEEPQETEEEKKARLKKEKKEAKEKKKKEKQEAKEKKKKEKKPKEKKEKKPKPPKEKDNTPPLPKKPVILMFVMAVSFLLLVMLGSNLVNYSSSISAAEQALDKGDYTKAYEEIAGIEVKEGDMEVYEKARVLASLQSQYESYEIFMQYENYDLALDALISVIGRYDINYEDAQTYGCTVELGLIEQSAEDALMEHFGVTAEQAREMYGLRDREEYSLEVYKIIYSLGLEKVTEE
ncbi:MAG: hypothetical protein ACI4ES_06615 [Roseburia sp.]